MNFKKKDNSKDHVQAPNFEKAIQNLTDIMINTEKFDEIMINIYSAIDIDDKEILTVEAVVEFFRKFLEGE